jgi:hypothetical protein
MDLVNIYMKMGGGRGQQKLQYEQDLQDLFQELHAAFSATVS